MKLPLAILIGFFPLLVSGVEEKTSPATPAAAAIAESAPALPRKPAYKPPKVGAPAVRVAGGSRGQVDEVVLQAIVPDHPAHTLQAQPVLYWFQSKPVKARFEISITAPGRAENVLLRVGDGQKTAGLHRLDLTREKDAKGQPIELQPGIAYKWVAALVPDPKNRSKDSVSSGVIELIAPPPGLAEKLKTAAPAERACLLVEHGVWYDGLADILGLAAKHPENSELKTAGADLIASVGLKEAAEAARK